VGGRVGGLVWKTSERKWREICTYTYSASTASFRYNFMWHGVIIEESMYGRGGEFQRRVVWGSTERRAAKGFIGLPKSLGHEITSIRSAEKFLKVESCPLCIILLCFIIREVFTFSITHWSDAKTKSRKPSKNLVIQLANLQKVWCMLIQ